MGREGETHEKHILLSHNSHLERIPSPLPPVLDASVDRELGTSLHVVQRRVYSRLRVPRPVCFWGGGERNNRGRCVEGRKKFGQTIPKTTLAPLITAQNIYMTRREHARRFFLTRENRRSLDSARSVSPTPRPPECCRSGPVRTGAPPSVRNTSRSSPPIRPTRP